MFEPVAYTFEADLHCPECASARFGGRGGEGAVDREGETVKPVYPYHECVEHDWLCGDCGELIKECFDKLEEF